MLNGTGIIGERKYGTCETMKNVAVLLTSVPQSGGEHLYLKMVMEALIANDQRKFRVLAVCCNDYWQTWCRKNHVKRVFYKLEKYSLKKMRFNAYLRFPALVYNTCFSELGRIVSENKIDLLVGGQQSIFIPRLKCRVVQPVHDLMHRYEAQYDEIKSTFEWREMYFSSEARIADLVLVDSELGKAQYRECYYKKGKHVPRIRVLPFAPPEFGDKKEEYVETPAKYIFYPAQFWEHKNHKNLISAVRLLKERLTDIRLILVGSERNVQRKIERLITDYGLESHVLIRGFVSDEQLIYLYRHAVALVMPTQIGPTNIPPLEAMALGCPVIVSNKYAMPDQVGNAGLSCDPNSAEDIAACIEKVWSDEKLRQDMIQKGYERSKKWTANAFKKRFIKIIMDELDR